MMKRPMKLSYTTYIDVSAGLFGHIFIERMVIPSQLFEDEMLVIKREVRFIFTNSA